MELLDLLLPSNCALCNCSGPAICENCKSKFQARDFDIHRTGLSGFSATSYTEDSAKLIHEFKEGGQTSLAKFFASLIAPRISQFSKSGAILVPAPSTKSASLKRGFQPAQVLAQQLGRQTGLASFNALKPKFEVADQAALSRGQRLANLLESMIASRALAGLPVILVDDIVTTGATLAEARRAVTAAGGIPIFFATFAETIRKIGNGFSN